MKALAKYRALATKYGFKIKPVGAMINGSYCRRPDVFSVQYQGRPVTMIPKRMYTIPNPNYRDLMGNVQPFYAEAEKRLKEWTHTIKRSPYLEQYK